ncbi:MAG: hypothetical protein NC218_10035 [Acetobacter sp.]|nr:hypothetical protein [Acetobacter sp.]MCM1324454.1 hypothetical protein [Acetobacter sp.]
MKKAENVKEFVERIDATKKVNPKDLSSDQDLTIAIMNLISIEEHLVFSGAKTGKTSFYDLIEDVRETRKKLMLKIIPSYEGEVWCISKHLLASSMRLMEVGTKQQSLGNKEQAYDLFNKAYDLYCLFWGLNMNMLNVSEMKWIEDSVDDIKKISEKINAAAPLATASNGDVVVEDTADADGEPKTAFSKMKAFVRKAVDCCIE